MNSIINHTTHKTERKARRALIEIFEKFGYVVTFSVSATGISDYGEDLTIEICNPLNGAVLPYSFEVQSKGKGKIVSVEGKYVTCSIKTKHLKKWKNSKIPVVLAAFDEESGDTYWLLVQDYIEHYAEKYDKDFNKKLKEQREINIRIPIINVLNETGIKIITAKVIDKYNGYNDESGLKILEYVYQTEPGRKILFRDYHAGLLGLELPNGDVNMKLFGELAKEFHYAAWKAGIEPLDVNEGLNRFFPKYVEILQNFDENSRLEVTLEGKHFEFTTLEEFFEWIERNHDLMRYDMIMDILRIEG